ncbi:unnamed protein product [Acanthosepion pharaonis]|uniref:Uncharacterized protein n=1 Tax=Acanthosepion pharaonis TaxID=158019 RepID=A0A812EG44_ACAPH|nr:unnamed protein product [Sepia pharaonis]
MNSTIFIKITLFYSTFVLFYSNIYSQVICGKTNPLLPNDTCIELKTNHFRFDEYWWFMPKTSSLFDLMKNYTERFWIGLYIQNGVYYWGDQTELEDKEKKLFLKHNYKGNETRCAVYENKSIEFVQCACRNNGLADKASNYSRFANFPKICKGNNTGKTTAKPKTRLESRTTNVGSTQPIITATKKITSGGMTSDTSFMKSSQTISAAVPETTSEGFTTSELTTASHTSTVKEKRCNCSCRRNNTTEFTMEEIRKIFLSRKETSRYKRSKESAPDERKSSKVIAGVAVVAISATRSSRLKTVESHAAASRIMLSNLSLPPMPPFILFGLSRRSAANIRPRVVRPSHALENE